MPLHAKLSFCIRYFWKTKRKSMEGHSGQKCNLIAPSIPLDHTFLPFDRTFIPLDRTFLPFDRTFLPFDRTFIPSDRTFLPFDRTSIPFDRTFHPFDRIFIPLDRACLPFDRTSIILSLAILHWFIPLWYFTFNRTSVETAFHRIVTIVRP